MALRMIETHVPPDLAKEAQGGGRSARLGVAIFVTLFVVLAGLVLLAEHWSRG